jgi:type I restriction enzyme S subunit
MTLDLDKSTWKRVKFGDVVKNINDYFSPETDGVLPYVAGPHIDPESMRVRAYGKTSDDNFPQHSRGSSSLATYFSIPVA